MLLALTHKNYWFAKDFFKTKKKALFQLLRRGEWLPRDGTEQKAVDLRELRRVEGQVFQHLVIRYLRTWGHSFGISGLSPHAAIPTAACTGEQDPYASSPVTISQSTIPKLYALLIQLSLVFSGSPAIIWFQPFHKLQSTTAFPIESTYA